MIYYVEDDKSIRELVLYTLKTTGFEAKGFECGRDMFAVNGQFGIYVKCSDNHISKLEEI